MTDNSSMIKIEAAQKMKGNITGEWRKLKNIERREGIYAEKEKGEKEYADPLCGGACIFRYGKHGRIINGCERRSCPQKCGEKIKGQYRDGEESCLKR